MKHLLQLILAAIITTSCSTTPQEKAEKSIQTYLKENLRNPSTYASKGFSKVDTVFQADTLLESLVYLNRPYKSMLEFSKSDSSMLDFYKGRDEIPYQKYISNLKARKTRIDSLKQIIDKIRSSVDLNEAQANLVEYRIKHDYEHKGLDEELVDLRIDFTLDNEFNLKRKKIKKGINGQGYFDITILSKNSTNYYIEFVVDPKIDDQIINSGGLTDLHIKTGKHYLTWTASNKNGFGVLTNPETFRKEIILEDSEENDTYFVINGKSYWTYKNKDEAEKDEYYTKYIIGN